MNNDQQPDDLLAALVQIAAANPLVAAIVLIGVGFWAVGKIDTALPTVKREPTEDELLAALERVRNKKKSSPQMREVVAALKSVIEKLEEGESL